VLVVVVVCGVVVGGGGCCCCCWRWYLNLRWERDIVFHGSEEFQYERLDVVPIAMNLLHVAYILVLRACRQLPINRERYYVNLRYAGVVSQLGFFISLSLSFSLRSHPSSHNNTTRYPEIPTRG